MLELKEEEFADLYYGEKNEKQKSSLYEVNIEGKKKERFVTDCQIDTDLEILFPEEYVSNVSERIRLYRELDSLENMDHLQKFSSMLIDRFGQIPLQVEELMNVVKLRWLAMDLGFEKMILKDSKLLVYFVANPMSPYYQSEVFQRVLHFIQKQPSRYRMKEAKEKLNMTIDRVANVSEALKLLGIMNE